MRRLVVWGVLLLLVMPVSWAVVGWLKKPVLYAGDRLEYRTCRECGGSGVEAGDTEGPVRPGGPCIVCRGKKQVAVVIPGPNHPCKVRGEVFDAKARPGAADPDSALLEMHNGPAAPVR